MSERSGDTWVGSALSPATSGSQEGCLVHIYPSGPDMGRRYPLPEGKMVIGRSEGVEIRVQDYSVSRNHAVVETTPDGTFVIDQKSLNGTIVNDEVVRGAHQLSDGDTLRIGNAIFRFLTGGNIEADYHEEIYRLTIMDGLTRIHNRRYLVEFLDRELARANRHQRELSVLLFDIDKFKTINDEKGHLCGDHILRELSQRLQPTIRREDLLARYGGEEFCIVLVETPLAHALEIGERVRKSVAEEPFAFENTPISVTVSVGVASADGSHTAEDLLKEADEKMYKAKRHGRNRVVG